jgi:hypothetical protein
MHEVELWARLQGSGILVGLSPLRMFSFSRMHFRSRSVTCCATFCRSIFRFFICNHVKRTISVGAHKPGAVKGETYTPGFYAPIQGRGGRVVLDLIAPGSLPLVLICSDSVGLKQWPMPY